MGFLHFFTIGLYKLKHRQGILPDSYGFSERRLTAQLTPD